MKNESRNDIGRALIEQLAIPHRRRAAVRALLEMGYAASRLAIEGLRHEDAGVRRGCCEFLDHYLVPEALPPLIELLDDLHPRVRLLALHTLACDRCKEGDCRPEEKEVLPKAIRLLKEDPSPHTRAMAIEVIGNFVHTSAVAEKALVDAKSHDHSPAVRKKAGWYAPGGTIHIRTAPRPRRGSPKSQ